MGAQGSAGLSMIKSSCKQMVTEIPFEPTWFGKKITSKYVICGHGRDSCQIITTSKRVPQKSISGLLPLFFLFIRLSVGRGNGICLWKVPQPHEFSLCESFPCIFNLSPCQETSSIQISCFLLENILPFTFVSSQRSGFPDMVPLLDKLQLVDINHGSPYLCSGEAINQAISCSAPPISSVQSQISCLSLVSVVLLCPIKDLGFWRRIKCS